MAKQTARKRTTAQRTKDVLTADEVRPISEEEQDNEITAFRKKNAADQAAARHNLDLMVMVGIVFALYQILRISQHPRSIFLIPATVAQSVLLLCSISPGRIPIPPIAAAAQQHTMVTAAQLGLFLAIFSLVKYAPGTAEAAGMLEILRWALPELITGVVEMQRRSEREAELSINQLEKLRYPLKGA